MLQTIIAFAGFLATSVGVYVTFISSRSQASYIRRLAEIKERRALTELEQLRIDSVISIEEQLGEIQIPEADEITLSIIYPGSISFRNRDVDFTSKTSFTYYYSAIRVAIDGENIGSGKGDTGFRLETRVKTGYHVLTFSWEGEKDGYSEYDWQNKTTDLSGKQGLTIWVLRKNDCQLFLNDNFEFDHSAPDIIYPICYSCKMPGIFRCVSGLRFCAKHGSTGDPERVSADPPPLKWSSAMFRKTEETHGQQATKTRGDCHEVTAG